MPGNWPALFGKGPTEKARVTGTSPAAYFTLKASGGSRDPSLSQPADLTQGAAFFSASCYPPAMPAALRAILLLAAAVDPRLAEPLAV